MTDPIIELSNPLTASIDSSYFQISGTGTDGLYQNTQWTNKADTGGINVYQQVAYTDTDPISSKDNFAELRSTDASSAITTSFNNNIAPYTTFATLKSQSNQSQLSMATNDITTGLSATRDFITIGGSSVDSCIGTNGIATASRSEQTNYLNANEYLTFVNGSTNSYQQRFTDAFKAAENLQYQQGGSTTTTFLTDNTCDSGRARLRTQHTDTGGAVTINHSQKMEATGYQLEFGQAYNNSAVGTRNTSITTGLYGLAISCDSSINVVSSGGGVVLNASGGASVDLNTNSSITAQTHIFSSPLAGSTTIPNYIFSATNSTAASYPSIKLDRPNVNSGTGETLGSISYFGDDSTGVNMEWARIQTKTENVSTGNQDGTISIFNRVNNVLQETFNFNGGQNENNSFRPLDMNGNNIRTSTGSLTIDVNSSTTTGSTFTISTKDNVAGSGAGLVLNGNTLTSLSAGASSGSYLCLTINGVVYKIQLLNV